MLVRYPFYVKIECYKSNISIIYNYFNIVSGEQTAQLTFCVCAQYGACHLFGWKYCDPDVCGPLCRPEQCCCDQKGKGLS